MYNTPGQPLSEALNGSTATSYTTKGSSILGDIAERVGLNITPDQGGTIAPQADPSPASLVMAAAKPQTPNMG